MTEPAGEVAAASAGILTDRVSSSIAECSGALGSDAPLQGKNIDPRSMGGQSARLYVGGDLL